MAAAPGQASGSAVRDGGSGTLTSHDVHWQAACAHSLLRHLKAALPYVEKAARRRGSQGRYVAAEIASNMRAIIAVTEEGPAPAPTPNAHGTETCAVEASKPT